MSTSVKNGAKKSSRKGNGHIRATQEKRDDDIMNTNDSSIVSKRSVSKLYFPHEPDFYQPFVQKYVRRNPLINRGYWLRMHAIEQVVLRFLEQPSVKPRVIVNLGCGYDPLPFQFWYRYSSSCHNTTFVDIDYPQLIEMKRDRIFTDSILRDALLKTNIRSSEKPVYLRSDKYMGLGCDLRDLDALKRILDAELGLSSSSVLFIAEVSITYMPLTDSSALIHWASKFDDAKFCLLEQYLPQGPDHPFAQTMLRHFNKLQTPIHAVKDNPSLNQQKSRFTDAGWPSLEIARNLWDLWSDENFTAPKLRERLDKVEPFDEWEEFALFAGHYFLIVASKSYTMQSQEVTDALPEIQGQDTNEIPSRTLVLTSHNPSPEAPLVPRRFGVACALEHHTIAIHGGQGLRNRLTSVEMLDRNVSKACIEPSLAPQARICHTISLFNKDRALLVGGRKSPSQSLTDAWVLEGGKWREVQQLTPGRFRHSAARVTVPSSGPDLGGVFVFGGKTGDGSVLDDCHIWTPNHGWQSVPVTGSRPPPRFGAAISSMTVTSNRGLIVGGMSPDGTVRHDIWEYNISTVPQLQVRFSDRTNDIRSKSANPLYARFGASMLPFGNLLLLIGGISSREMHGLPDEILLISVGSTIHIEKPLISFRGLTYPLLVGFGATPVSKDEVIVAGGGAVCFSMGSFWNQGLLSITKEERPDAQPWSVSSFEAAGILASSTSQDREEQRAKRLPQSRAKGNAGRENATQKNVTDVTRIRLHSAEDFVQILKSSKPVIIEHLNLGPCSELWTLEYLKDKVGACREVVIHDSSSDRMTFKDKNFQYIKTSFGLFIDGISQGSKTYLRAVSSSQPNKLPTKLEDDFPTIADDFRLPEELASIKETYHSSPLRISGPVSLWLHYDVLANVLCQIRGTKTLHLYPPSDVKYLDFPPGGSSSNTNVLSPDPSQTSKLRHTHPYIASLKPGDVLFIPPMWSHTATPEEGYSVAVNVFFKNLEKGYAAGKDVYGNRDLQAYENGRRDVERIFKAFRDVPSELGRFYIERLAMELQEKADAIGDT